MTPRGQFSMARDKSSNDLVSSACALVDSTRFLRPRCRPGETSPKAWLTIGFVRRWAVSLDGRDVLSRYPATQHGKCTFLTQVVCALAPPHRPAGAQFPGRLRSFRSSRSKVLGEMARAP